MAVFFCILSGILAGGLGVYFIAWEIVNLQFDEYLVMGIILCIISFVCFFQSYRIHKTNKELKDLSHREKQSTPPPDIRPHDPFPVSTPKQPQSIKPPEQSKTPVRPIPDRTVVQPEPAKAPPRPARTASFPLLQTDDNNLLWFRKYQYEREVALSGVTADTLASKRLHRIRFQCENDNPENPFAVAAYIDDVKIGYIHNGYVQDMINDWIKRDDLFGAFLSSVDPSQNKAVMQIAFYKPADKINSKVFSLSKMSKKDSLGTPRSEFLYLCSAGDIVEIEEDVLEDCYVVSCDGNEIGELGESFANWLGDNNIDEFGGIIETLEENDDGKYKVTIKVYGT